MLKMVRKQITVPLSLVASDSTHWKKEKGENHVFFGDRICSCNFHSCELGFRFISGSYFSKSLHWNHCCQLNILAKPSVLSMVFQAWFIYSSQHHGTDISYPVYILCFWLKVQNIFFHLFILFTTVPRRMTNC